MSFLYRREASRSGSACESIIFGFGADELVEFPDQQQSFPLSLFGAKGLKPCSQPDATLLAATGAYVCGVSLDLCFSDGYLRRYTFLRVHEDFTEKNILGTFIQVDKDKWKAFLEELSEFEKKYQRLLNMLDMTENRLDALKTPEKKEGESAEALRQLSVKSPEKVVGGEAKRGFLSRLEAKLEPPGRRNTRPGIPRMPQAYASCSRCGFQIVRATRFCQRCGADFGKVACSCGHELGSGDRFCDRCGRGV